MINLRAVIAIFTSRARLSKFDLSDSREVNIFNSPLVLYSDNQFK